MSTSHGRFVWYDLMTPDLAGATAFYTKVANWGTMPFPESPKPYTMWTAGNVPLGGMMEITPDLTAGGVAPHWMGYVAVDNVDDSAKKAKSLGGKIHLAPTDIPTVGRFAVIQDPQNAYIAIFTPSTPPPAEEPLPNVGNVSWHELMTSDYAAAFDFYTKLFGWQQTSEMDMGRNAGMYRMFSSGGPPAGGMFTLSPDMPMPPSWVYYIKVADIAKAIETTKQLGGQLLNGPMEVPGGDLVAQTMDPQGAMFALHQAKAS